MYDGVGRKGENANALGIFRALGMDDVVHTCMENQNRHPIFKETYHVFEFIKNMFENKKKLLSIGFFNNNNNDDWSHYFPNTLNFLFVDLMLLDINNCKTISYETDQHHYKHTASVSSPNSVSCNCRLFSNIPKHYEALVRTDNRRYLGGGGSASFHGGMTSIHDWGIDGGSPVGLARYVDPNDLSTTYGVFANATHESNQTYAFTSVFFLSAKKYDETDVGSSIRFETSLSAILERYRIFHLRCKKEFVVNVHQHTTKNRSLFLNMFLLLIFALTFTYLSY
jgi:hypothetical protein